MKYRTPSKNNPYWVEPERYRAAVHFCRCYPLWLKELESLPDSSKAITYDGDKVQTSGGYDVTSALALKRVEVERKVDLIRTTAMITNAELWEWIIKGVTENVTARDLIQQGMPCSERYFTKIRGVFYYYLSRRIT